jgi:hypothetical protein
MFDKQKYIRSLKKDYLLFKKRKSESHRSLADGVAALVDDEEFHHIDSDTLQAFHLKTLEKGVGGNGHSEYKNSNLVDYEGTASSVWYFEDAFLKECKESSIFVIPLEWHLAGGLLISLKAFLKNFQGLSYLMDDDMDLYDLSLNNSLIIRGDRTNSQLTYCETVSRGNEFVFLQEYWNERNSVL